eukprot:scaffold152_cov121-Skeletonema_marinoi.AAC.3
MAIYNGPLETVDCHIHSVRYDMAVNREAGGISDASSGHLRRCSDAEAVDCHIRSVRYDMVLESRAGGRLRWPHQVTYDVVATPIRGTNA